MQTCKKTVQVIIINNYVPNETKPDQSDVFWSSCTAKVDQSTQFIKAGHREATIMYSMCKIIWT